MKRILALVLAAFGASACLMTNNTWAQARIVNPLLRVAAVWLERGQRTPKPTLRPPNRQSLSRGGHPVALKPRTVRVVETRALDVSSPIVALSEQGDVVWLGTFDEGLFQTTSSSTAHAVSAVDARVNDLTVTAEGRLLVATNAGAFTVKGENVQQIASGVFTASTRWRDDVYLTSRQGLSKVEPRGLWTQGSAQGLGADNPSVLAPCGEGLCIGAVDGMWLFDGQTFIRKSSADDTLTSDWVTAVASSPSGTWIGTFDAGLSFIPTGASPRRFGREDGLPEGRVQPHGLAVVNGTAAAATPTGLLLLDESGGVTHVRAELPDSELFSVIPSARGGVWVGYRGGASRVVWEERR